MSFIDKMKNLFKSGKKVSNTEILNANKDVLIEKIKQSTLFNGLDKQKLEQIFNKMEPVAVRNGETIIKEGDEGDYYYLLAAGTAKVTRMSETGEQITIAELNAVSYTHLTLPTIYSV